MARQLRDFTGLRGRLVGISDRALAQHIEVYERHVKELEAIEAQRPMTDVVPSGFTAPAASLDQLLATPVKDLELEPVGELKAMLGHLSRELAAAGIPFMPLTYLGDGDWWTSDRAISVNVPWYLANPTLWRLAARQRATTYTPETAMKTLRHETGHAVCYAWELWRNPIFTKLFGNSLEPYRDEYTPVEGSKDYVEYLADVPDHYAQKHPDEDFAETLACWLDPLSNWRTAYGDWPKALEKLTWVDRLARAGYFQQDAPNLRPGRAVPYTSLKGTVGELLGVAEGARPFAGIPGWSEHAELLRRYPHALNAVALHDLYFEALGGDGVAPSGRMLELATTAYGSWDGYLRDLRAAAGVASPGWAVTHYDPVTQTIVNAVVEGNTSGLLAGQSILLALDCWEHAYAPDFGARKDVYLAALFRNLDWGVIEGRLL